MEIKVVVGGSGRWIAREITGRYANGRPRMAGRVWTGIAPRHANRETVAACVSWAMRRGEAGSAAVRAAPKGGWTFEAVVSGVAEAITVTAKEEKQHGYRA